MKVATLTALRAEFADLQKKAGERIETVAVAKRDFSAEESAANDADMKRLEQIKTVIEKSQKLAEQAFSKKTNPDAEQFDAEGNPVETPGHVEGAGANPQGESDIVVVRDRFENAPQRVKVKRVEFARAINAWAMQGKLPKQFATITTASESGIFLPTEVDEPIIPSAPNTIREALSLYNQQAMSTPGTELINLPVADANSGGVVAENASSETENEPSLTESIVLAPKTYQSGSSWFSNQQLMAVNYDLMSAILPALAYSKELALESQVITTMYGDSGVTQNVPTATVSGFTYANMVTFNRLLPKRFNPMKVILLSKAAYTAAENLTTTTGYPILNALNPQNTSLKYFNGTPVLWTDYLQAFGANNVVGLVFSLIGFRLRDCGQQQVQRYTQYPARPSQTGFNLYGYHAFGYADGAVGKLVCPAS